MPTDSEILIQNTLSEIKAQTGLELKLCDYFTGVRKNANGKYFNVLLNDSLELSNEYTQLCRYAEKYKSIKLGHNGVRRVSIFPVNQ